MRGDTPIEVKPGYQTSEFWVTVISTVGVFTLLALGKIDIDDVKDLIPIGGVIASYIFSRGVVKSGFTSRSKWPKTW